MQAKRRASRRRTRLLVDPLRSHPVPGQAAKDTPSAATKDPLPQTERSEPILSLRRISRTFRPLSPQADDKRRAALSATLPDARPATLGIPYSETAPDCRPPLPVATRPKTAGVPKTVAGVEVPTHYTSSVKPLALGTSKLAPVEFVDPKRKDIAGVRSSRAGEVIKRKSIPKLEVTPSARTSSETLRSVGSSRLDLAMLDPQERCHVPRPLNLGPRSQQQPSNESLVAAVSQSSRVDAFTVPDQVPSKIRRPSRLRLEVRSSLEVPNILPALPIRDSSRSWKSDTDVADTPDLFTTFPEPQGVDGISNTARLDTPGLISSFPVPGPKNPARLTKAVGAATAPSIASKTSRERERAPDWSWLDLTQESSDCGSEVECSIDDSLRNEDDGGNVGPELAGAAR